MTDKILSAERIEQMLYESRLAWPFVAVEIAASHKALRADRDRLAARLAEVERERDAWKRHRMTGTDHLARANAAEARVAKLEAALREVHDRSLLPFDDNDRRWIGERARAALGEQDR